ncbi:cupin domain-containing protein [Terriglobus saanensis]|uniref:Cupin 2 conserved barrel domain protein n=1 Tax=Terriglobus saanensis (strain ATCC BAA-1853 / DSM 23119 / SP1PR4) TaxID=401053 RepID=E8V0H2_TERSS|nr:cupin domain-containing protein [Terriglobus saanensis]ADV84455.1 Cupin 2 conserved barrel domain protein [Terriglobus saanensis SP1PR4]
MTETTTIANGALTDPWLQTRPGELCAIRVDSAETNGTYSVVEIVASPGDSTPIHVHAREDEHFVILEGTARIAYGEKTFDAPTGTSISLMRGISHAWGNPSPDSKLRMLVTCTPGGAEEALRLIAKGGDIDLMAIAKKSGVEILGPPLLGIPPAQ